MPHPVYRLRVTHASTGVEETYGNDVLGEGQYALALRAARGSVELASLTVSFLSGSFLGAGSKPFVPRGLHRATVEVSEDGGSSWAASIDGVVTYEGVSDGSPLETDGGLKTPLRWWTATVKQDASERMWKALGDVDLPDLAADLVTDGSHVDIGFERITGSGDEAVTCRMWRIRDTILAALDAAGVAVSGTFPDVFPWERRYDDVSGGDPVTRLHRKAETDTRAVLVGRPQLTGAPSPLYGSHPTMPEENAAWLLALVQDAMQLLLVPRYDAYPAAGLTLEAVDARALEDPQSLPSLESVTAHVFDGWRRTTEPALDDGERLGDFAMVYGGGPDGSATDGADTPIPLVAAYASSRVALAGTAGERTVENADVMEMDWRLCAHNSVVNVATTASPGYNETTRRGVPVFGVEESYLAASGGTPEQEGDPSIVRLVVAERATTGDPWRSVSSRSGTRTIGGRVTSMEAWAIELYRRQDLRAGDVDVLTCAVGLGAVDLGAIKPGQPAAGITHDALRYVVREVQPDFDAGRVDLRAVRPTGGWNPEPASGDTGPGNTSGGTGAAELDPTVAVVLDREETTGPDGPADLVTYYSFRMDVEVPPESAAPESIELDFTPATVMEIVTQPTPYRLTASRTDEAAGHGGTHPQDGTLCRARAHYAGGRTSSWVSVTASE